MLSKIVVFFLIFMLALGMFGKWRRKILGRLSGKTQAGLRRPAKCRACGKYLLGDAPCSCGKG